MTSYPERPPESLAPVEKFTFSTSQVDHAKHDCDLRLDAMRERLRKISDKCCIPVDGINFNVIEKILALTHDVETLQQISAGLARIATFIEEYDKTQERMKVLELIEKDTGWIASAFGEFDTEIEGELADMKKLSELDILLKD